MTVADLPAAESATVLNLNLRRSRKCDAEEERLKVRKEKGAADKAIKVER